MISDVLELRRSRRRLDGLPANLKPEHLERPAKAWRQFALCLRANPDLWFPVEQDGGTEAVTICWACPVRIDCLGWAIEHNEREGIWGGLSAKSRVRLRQATTTTTTTRTRIGSGAFNLPR